jgi:hypothetical protein
MELQLACPDSRDLLDYARLTSAPNPQLEAHIAQCRICAEKLAQFRKGSTIIQSPVASV